MATITPRPGNFIRDVRNIGVADKAHWQRISEAASSLREAEPTGTSLDAPLSIAQRSVTTAKSPRASDVTPLSAMSSEQMLATFGRIEMLLDRAVAAHGGQRPELELGRTAIASHVRRVMMLQAGRDGLVGS